MDILIEALIWFAIAYMLTRLATTWLMSWLISRIENELMAEVGHIVKDIAAGKLIPLTVEVDQNQYLCYNSITMDFVCQGTNLKEIAERFKARYPDKRIAIHNGDEEAVKTLKLQAENLNENRNSI